MSIEVKQNIFYIRKIDIKQQRDIIFKMHTDTKSYNFLHSN